MKLNNVSGIIVGLVVGTLLMNSALADASAQIGNVTVYYSVTNGEATITSALVERESHLDLPSTIGGRSLTKIGELAFAGRRLIKSLTLPETLTFVGREAFKNCTGLTNVMVNCEKVSFGHQAFAGSGVKRVVFSGDAFSEAWVGAYPFEKCNSLNSVVFLPGSEEIGSRLFGYSTLKTVEISKSVTHIGYDAFQETRLMKEHEDGLILVDGCLLGVKNVQDVVVPESCRVIAEEAFSDAIGLKSIAFMNSWESLPSGVFSGNKTLEKVVLPSGLHKLPYACFSGCTALVTIENLQGIEEYGSAAFERCQSFSSFQVPDSVKCIGARAFSDCTSLKAIKLPTFLQEIPNYLFFGCESLTEVDIPAGVKKIGTYAFCKCKALSEITIPPLVRDLPTHVFGECSSLLTMQIPVSLTNVHHEAFYDVGKGGILPVYKKIGKLIIYPSLGITSVGDSSINKATYNIERIEFEEGITAIDSDAFSGYGIYAVKFPNSLTNIGAQAFSYNRNLQSVEIPESVKTIGAQAFYNNLNLRSVIIPESVKTMGYRAFEGCSSLTNVTATISALPLYDYFRDDPIEMVTILGNPDYICGSAFSGFKSLKSVVLPASICSIGVSAFNGCESLQELLIPPAVKYIGHGAFCNCRALEHFDIPEGMTMIEAETFSGCVSLKTVKIPSSVTGISSAAFANCQSLLSVQIPDTVVVIGTTAFSNCKSLSHVDLPSRLKDISAGLFEGCEALQEIALPNTVTNIGYQAFAECSALTSMVIPPSVLTIDSEAFSSCENLVAITLPSSVDISFGGWGNAFNSCKKLRQVTIAAAERDPGLTFTISSSTVTNIVIREGVTNICMRAFSSVPLLMDVTIPSSVRDIGYEAFNNCESLRSVTCAANIGMRAFGNCKSLSEVVLLPGTRSIGATAFYGCCKLTFLTVPESVTDIGNNAFFGCENLSSLTMKTLPPKWWTVTSSIPTVDTVYCPAEYVSAWQNAYPTLTIVSLDQATFSLTFLAGDGTGSMPDEKQGVNRVYKLPKNVLIAPVGKRFVGWACSNGKRYDDGMLVFDLAQPGETVTMTAIWE